MILLKVISISIFIFTSLKNGPNCDRLHTLSVELSVDLYPEEDAYKQVVYVCRNDTLEINETKGLLFGDNGEMHFQKTKTLIPFSKIKEVYGSPKQLKIKTHSNDVQNYKFDNEEKVYKKTMKLTYHSVYYSFPDLKINPPEELKLELIEVLASTIQAIANEYE